LSRMVVRDEDRVRRRAAYPLGRGSSRDSEKARETGLYGHLQALSLTPT